MQERRSWKLLSWRTAVVVLALGAVLAGAAVYFVPSLRWRAHVVALHAFGQIPDVEWSDVVMFVKPGSAGYDNLQRLADTRNPYAVVANPRTSAADVATGRTVFESRCIACHGANGVGGAAAPALAGREFKHGDSDWALYRTIRFGVPGTGMPAHDYSPEETWRIVAYIRSLDVSEEASDAPSLSAVNVPYEELASIVHPGDDWLTFSGSYSSHRYSALTQITPANVRRLGVRWIHQLEGVSAKIETSPLVRKGAMFITVPNGGVLALDALTGKRLWKFDAKPLEGAVGGEFGVPVNRGVALLNDKVYVGTGDARLFALDSRNGAVVWEVQVAPPEKNYISAAPLTYRDMVVTGLGNKGGRGLIVAYDAQTGKERWRFVTIPGPGEFGNDTWSGDSWKEGGAPTWMTGSYVPEKDLLIWGAGNPKPDYDTDVRKGDNLYSNTVLALEGATGKLVWHFQFTPADDKDWDSNQVPILAQFPGANGPERRVLWANRNGFYYVLDGDSGKYLNSAPMVHQTWTAGIDENGRPKPPSEPNRRAEGYVVYPGNVGGTNWWPPAYDEARGLFFAPVIEQGMVFFSSKKSWPRPNGKPFYTAVRALDARTGRQVWEHRSEARLDVSEIGGLLSTASGVLFGGDLNTFFALDSQTGQRLWSIETGGLLAAAPVTYAVGGEQYVVVAAGRNLLAFALPPE